MLGLDPDRAALQARARLRAAGVRLGRGEVEALAEAETEFLRSGGGGGGGAEMARDGPTLLRQLLAHPALRDLLSSMDQRDGHTGGRETQ